MKRNKRNEQASVDLHLKRTHWLTVDGEMCKPIIIRNSVWLGDKMRTLREISIGNSVVTAKTCVPKSLEDNRLACCVVADVARELV